MTERIGLYGGSFDPIHFGHLISARCLAERLDFSRLILVPSARPPHKRGSDLAAAPHRLEMTRLAVEGDPLFEVSDAELLREGLSYTIDTVMECRRRLGPTPELFWIIGADTLPELPTWHRVAELVTHVRIVTATRPGWQPPDVALLASAVGDEPARRLLGDCYETPSIDISSTDIRSRVRSGRSVQYLLPASVASYITAKGLYKSGSDATGEQT